MKGRKKKKIVGLAIALVGFAAYFASVYNYSLLEQIPASWQICCGDEGGQTAWDYKRIQAAVKEEGSSGDYAFWKQETDQEVENPDLSRSCSLSVWKIRGSLEVLFRPFILLQEDDIQGCYLSEEAARELFGGIDVIGNSVLYGERQLTVRGILKGNGQLLAARPKEDETTDRITLEEQSKRQVESFQMQYQIQGKAVNSQFLEEILQCLVLLFPCTLAIGFFRRLSRAVPDRSCVPGSWFLGRGAWWMLMTGFILFLFSMIDIPETMIPDKWSDFQFWGLWWESAKEQIGCFIQMEKVGQDLARMEHFVKSTVFLVMSVLAVARSKSVVARDGTRWYDRNI